MHRVHRGKKENRIEANAAVVAYAVLAVVILLAALYAFTHYEGPTVYGDDIIYVGMAESVLHGSFVESTTILFSVRLLQFYPVAMFLLLGLNNLTVTLWDITSYLGVIVVAFYFAKLFYSYREGLIAAFLVSIFPLATQFAVNVGEDMPLAFIASLAVLLFVYGERRRNGHAYFASGALLVASWLVSYESGIVIAFVVLYALVEVARGRIKIDRISMYFVYGVAVALLVTFVYSYLDSGMPFITITDNLRFYSVVSSNPYRISTISVDNTNLMFYPDAMFQYGLVSIVMHSGVKDLLGNLKDALLPSVPRTVYGMYFYFALLCAAVLLVLRDRRSFFALFWLAFSVAFLEFGPMSVISLHPLSLQYLLANRTQRFMLIAVVPLAAVMAAGFGKLLNSRNGYLLVVGAIVVFLVLLLLYVQNLQIENYWYYSQMYPEGIVMQSANFIKGLNPNATVYIEMPLAPNDTFSDFLSSFWVYMGSYNEQMRLVDVVGVLNCSDVKVGSYIVWSGPAKCGNWKNVFNVTVPHGTPGYAIGEVRNLSFVVTNVYHVG